MKKWIIIISGTAALLVGGLFAAEHSLGDQKLKSAIEEACSNFLQRKVTIETLNRAPFPRLDVKATGLRVTDNDGKPLIECPNATIQVSAFSLLWLTLTLDEIRFIKPVIHYRGTRKGDSNIRDVVQGLKKTKSKKASKFKLSYDRFVIEDGVLEVTDRDTGGMLLPARLILNGGGAYKKAFKGPRFPFEVSGKFEDIEGTDLALKGTLSKASLVTGVVRNMKAAYLATYAPVFRGCDGTFDLELWWKKVNQRSAWRAEFNPRNLCVSEPVDFPMASLEYFGSSSPPRLEGVLKSSSSLVQFDANFPQEHKGFSSISVKGKVVDIMEMFRWERGIQRALALRTKREPAATPRPWKTVVHVNISTAVIRNETINNVWCDIERSSAATTRIDLSSAAAFGGMLLGRIDVAGSTAVMQLHGNNLRVERIFSLFSSTDNAEGNAMLDAVLTSQVGPQFLNRATGEVYVEVKDGSLPKTPAILSVLTSANVKTLSNYLEGKRGTGGIPVDKGMARIYIKDGKAAANEDNPWVLENEVMQAAFVGVLDYANRKVDGRVVLQVLTLPDELVNLVPGLRFLLFGKQRSFFPIFVRISGSFDNPTTRVQGAKTVTAPFLNTVGRILRLPKDTLDLLKGEK